jgi:hypothetical protein
MVYTTKFFRQIPPFSSFSAIFALKTNSYYPFYLLASFWIAGLIDYSYAESGYEYWNAELLRQHYNISAEQNLFPAFIFFPIVRVKLLGFHLKLLVAYGRQTTFNIILIDDPAGQFMDPDFVYPVVTL